MTSDWSEEPEAKTATVLDVQSASKTDSTRQLASQLGAGLAPTRLDTELAVPTPCLKLSSWRPVCLRGCKSSFPVMSCASLPLSLGSRATSSAGRGCLPELLAMTLHVTTTRSESFRICLEGGQIYPHPQPWPACAVWHITGGYSMSNISHSNVSILWSWLNATSAARNKSEWPEMCNSSIKKEASSFIIASISFKSSEISGLTLIHSCGERSVMFSCIFLNSRLQYSNNPSGVCLWDIADMPKARGKSSMAGLNKW